MTQEQKKQLLCIQHSRRCVALAANLACNGGSYPGLSPAYLYSSPLAPVFRAAVDYWYSNRD